MKQKKSDPHTLFDHERHLYSEGYLQVIGVDEVGRGPLAGPVVAAAATLKNPTKHPFMSGSASEYNRMWDTIKDSKKLSEGKRDSLRAFINEHYIVGVGMCTASEIDQINILQASFLAMKRAINQMGDSIATTNQIVLVDGNKTLPEYQGRQTAIIKGDDRVQCIAAASIVAKVTRDAMMTIYDEKYPEYGFAQHKGYGTKAHKEALEKHGITKIHRKTFQPIKGILASKIDK